MATMSTAASAEGLQLRAIDLVALQDVRKKDGHVAVYDVLHLVTGQEPNACRKMWPRLLETHPDVAAICRLIKFNDTAELVAICHAFKFSYKAISQ